MPITVSQAHQKLINSELMTAISSSTLSGRTIAVTGASKGIGLGIVELLSAQGASVIAGARDVNNVQVEGAIFLPLDVTDETSVRAFADAAIQAGANALVNNAGVGNFKPVQDITLEDYRRVMDTNVLGTILMTRAFIPHFQYLHATGKQTGQVVNVTSDVSSRTFAEGGLYTASKHAQRAITRALAYEGEQYGLRVTEIRPGIVDTYFSGGKPGNPQNAAYMKPSDIAQAVLYALSAPQHLRVDEIMLHPVAQDVAF